MTDELSPTQALALWGLLARQGRAMNAEIRPALKAADRSLLVSRKLATVEKRGRSFELELTDAGWDWAKTHYDVPLPIAYKAMRDLLILLGKFIDRGGASLDEVIGQAPPPPSPPPPPLRATELRKLIEAGYLRITGGKRSEPVRLSKLRAELGALDRKVLDAGLARIIKAKREKASLSQLSDNKSIDLVEREAAFSPAGEPFHLIRIR